MTNKIKFLVWFFLTIILLSGFLITKRSFAAEQDNYIVLSHQYNRVFANLLIKKIQTIHKNYPVILYLKDGREVAGVFKGYNKSDESIWIEQPGHLFQMGYGVMELLDVRVLVKEPV